MKALLVSGDSEVFNGIDKDTPSGDFQEHLHGGVDLPQHRI
jgi:hypothetical protein